MSTITSIGFLVDLVQSFVIWYIYLYKLLISLGNEFQFTEEEQRLFENRFENGYDLQTDERYNAWLKVHHPEGSGTYIKTSIVFSINLLCNDFLSV